MTAFVWTLSGPFGNPGNNVVIRDFGDLSGDGKADLLLFDISSNMVEALQSNGAQQPNLINLGQISATQAPVGADLDATGNAGNHLTKAQPEVRRLARKRIHLVPIHQLTIGQLRFWELQPRGINP